MRRISDLRRAIRSRHGVESHLVAAERVVHGGEGVKPWEGDVLVFHLVDHPISSKCYVWEMEGELQIVLHAPRVATPEEAVRKTFEDREAREPQVGEGEATSGELILVARVESKPGLDQLVRSELVKLLEPTRAQPGCIRFELHHALDEPGTFFFYETWRCEGDFEAYLESPLFKAWCLGCEELVAARPEVSRWSSVA